MIGWALLFLLLVICTFNFPMYPTTDLDGSWRIALGYFFQKNAQFGRDVVFTYGPLGFSMGKTYSGLQYNAIIAMQLITAVLGSWVIIREGRRLQGLSRWAFFLSFLLFGCGYEDAYHMLVIVLMGFQLLRRGDSRRETIALSLALAGIASIKFTDLMLASLVVSVVTGHELWRRRWREAALVAGVFIGSFVAIWALCGQNPLNLPDYFRSSWSISQGYTAAMGLSTPWSPLWKAFVVLAIIGVYLLTNLFLNPNKPRALAGSALLAGFVFMNWKHGFVRADGHMIGFFFCALLPLTAYPGLLDDPPRLRRLHYAAFLLAGFFSLWGIESALYGVVRGAVGIVQDKVWNNITWALDPSGTLQRYNDRLLIQKESVNLVKTRARVGRASLDILGFEQATAIFNDFNYQPRPAIQSYSVFTPYLAGLNRAFYESDRAPEYLLLKIQSIDYRLSTMDDPEVLRLVPHRYDFIHSERGYQLWQRKPERFDAATAAPRPLQTTDLAVGEKLDLSAIPPGKPLWARVVLKQTLLGRLQAFLYKPPFVRLAVVDDTGKEGSYLMPLTQGDAGFILSPLIDDAAEYASFANGRPGRSVRSIEIQIKEGHRFLFAPTARIELSALPPTHTAEKYFEEQSHARFHMFQSYPVEFGALNPPSEATVNGQTVLTMHAPSEMTFNLPKKAREITGSFGFLPGAFSGGGGTNGAVFIIQWSNGGEKREIFRRELNPVSIPEDQIMQKFTVPLDSLEGGKLFLRIDPGEFGNYAWDWTYWTGIEIK